MKTKLLTLLVALCATFALWAQNNVITYAATEKLPEVEDLDFSGLHIDAFGVTISSHTFSNGEGTITFDGEVTMIGVHAFWECGGLTAITIPNSVTEIGEGAFCNCMGLISVTIPNSVTTIVGGAFYNCLSLTSITIGNSVTEIGSMAFGYCWNLTSVNISDLTAWCKIDFEDDGSNPLPYAQHLYLNSEEITDLTIPSSITKIKQYSFCNCIGLTSVTIPNSVTEIGDCAFYKCSGLTSITIPNSVTTIGEYAFFGCSGLTSVIIGTSVTTIGDGAFFDCIGLTTATFYGKKSIQMGDRVFLYAGDIDGDIAYHPINVKLYIPCGTMPIYQKIIHAQYYSCATTYTANYDYAMFGDFAYDYQIQSPDETYCPVAVLSEPNCENNDITFAAYPKLYFRFDGWSDGVQSLERTISITQDTTIVALGAYDNTCGENLTWSLDTISGILTISGSGAMNRVPWADWASKIKIINLPEGLTTIAAGAFAECSNVKEIIIPTTITSIGDGAFANCTGLRTITCFATNPPLAENYVFYGVSQYTKTYVLASSLEDYQFALGWRDLNLLPIGSTETTITTDTVIIQPSVTEATFTWPANPSADGYSLEITKDGVVFCTLHFNAQGQLTGIAFAPSRGGAREMASATMTANGWQFTVTGLNQASKYGYTLDALNASQQSIKHYEGEFYTDGYTGLEGLTVDNAQCTMKFIHNGQLLIKRNGKIYNAAGVLMK